jgi:tetratricopeptide (TPR) repeat protein
MVEVNGVPVRAVFDTGAQVSMLSLERAGKGGVKPGGPGVTEAGYAGGISSHAHVKSWVGPFDSLKLGDSEEIRHVRLRFGDIALSDDSEMLIGDDFFLSHRVFVAYSQRKMYFTYNGGPLFNLDTAGSADQSPPAAPDGAPAPAAAPLASDAPTDADGFARRGAASTARRDYAAAIADLTRALALDPKNTDYLVWRAQAEAFSQRPGAAQADLDLALTVKPGDVAILFDRADFHIGQQDTAATRQDLDAIERALAPDADERLKLASYYEFAAAYDQGVAQYDRWIAAHPKGDRMEAALNGRCWERALGGLALDKALADCNAALRLDSGQPDILDSRGLVRLRMGDVDAAIADYDAALRSNPGLAETLYARGVAKLRKGLKSEGDADLAAAARLNPKIADWAKARDLAP